MSTIKVDTIKNRGNAINLPNNFKIDGDSIVQGYTASGTEPSSPSTGDFWWDSSNDKLYRYINGEFKELTIAAPTAIPWGGDRGVFAGGDETSITDRMQYIDITTPGNTTDFGDLLQNLPIRYGAGASNSSRGLHIAGYNASVYGLNLVQYVTISTPGNAQDFGNLTHPLYYYGSCCSDGTKAFTFGGYTNGLVKNTIQQTVIATIGDSTDFGDLGSHCYYNACCSDATRAVCGLGRTRAGESSGSYTYVNTMEYITTANTGNSTDFGDLSQVRGQFAGTSDTTRGLFISGIDGLNNRTNSIDYITIQTTGNATDFGDITTATTRLAACSNPTRGVIGGGTTSSDTRVNVIEYVTIQSPGNATDFGDLAAANRGLAAFSGNPS
tara:strand:+ start:535 stop:1683 length:1149 start_codon:yes stop_codon:yes gene_type:complete